MDFCENGKIIYFEVPHKMTYYHTGTSRVDANAMIASYPYVVMFDGADIINV